MSPMSRPRSGKVLVLGRDTRAFLSVVRSLGRRGLEVHVGWCDARAAAARSRYVRAIHQIPPPSVTAPGWRDHLLDLLGRHGFDLVIPCHDPAVLPLQLHRKELAEFVDSIYLLDDPVFRVAFDKHASYELARDLGLCVPRRVRVRRRDDASSALLSLSLPVLVKPRASFTADRLARKHHVRWARSPEDLVSHVEALRPWGDVAVEECVPGRGVGVEVLAHQGHVLVAFQHLRLHEPPGGGGSSYRCSTELHPELLRATRRFLEALRYTGVAMMEFKVSPETRTWAFIEINARFWGSLPLALAAGVDFPYYLYQMWVEGQREFPRGYPSGVRCRNLVTDVRWLARTWQAGRHDTAIASPPRRRIAADLLRLLALRDHTDTFVVDDPWPGFAELLTATGRLVRLGHRWAATRLAAWPPIRQRRRARAREALRRARHVLFVCKGNIYRSPFAQRLAERELPDHVAIASCGYHPEAGRPCPEAAVHVAAEMGIDLRGHRSRPLSAARLHEADVVFVFDADNARTLRERYPWVMSRVYFLGALGERSGTIIQDPDGGTARDVRLSYEAIRDSLRSACAAATRRGERQAEHGVPGTRA